MSARKWAFKLTDIRRVVQAVKDMHLPVFGVRVEPDGSIYVDTSAAAAQPATENGRPNSFDQVLAQ
jgi:hypothetical protein